MKKFYEKAKKITRKVGEQISNQAEIQKINLEIAGKKDELLKNYRILGEKSAAYFRKNSPADDGIKQVLGEIKKINSQIKALERKIAAIRKKK